MIVADTCLITHLFNETDLTATAQGILKKDSSWILPSIWQEEYANVLSKKARKENRTINDVLELFNYTVKELKNCEIAVDNRRALKISIEYKISVYDAQFVVLAMNFNTLLVTEDKEILKNCPGIALGMRDFLNNTK